MSLLNIKLREAVCYERHLTFVKRQIVHIGRMIFSVLYPVIFQQFG